MDAPIAKLSAALVAASAEMPAVGLDQTNPFLKNRFASLGAVIAAVRPILAKHNLAIMQFACSDEQGRVGIRTRIIHSSGEFLEESIYLEATEEKGKSRAQVAGSIITYLRRYAQSALLNLYADEDTDGNASGASPDSSKPATVPIQPKPVVTPARSASEPVAKAVTLADKCKARFLAIIKEKALEPEAWLYAVDKSWILNTEKLIDARADKFPSTAEAADKALGEIQDTCDRLEQTGGMSQEEAEAYEAAHLPEPAKPTEPEFPTKQKDRPAWMDVAMHWGKQKDVKLGDMDRKYLFGLCMNWEPKPYNGKISPQDVALKTALDAAKEYHGFKDKEKQ